MSDSLPPHELQHARPPCPSPTPGVRSNSRPSSWWCHPDISFSVVPFSSCLQSLPASESFPMSQLFAWGGQSTGVSALASFLPNNIQDRSPLEWTGWISLQSKGLSRVFSNTTVQKLSFLHSPTLTSSPSFRNKREVSLGFVPRVVYKQTTQPTHTATSQVQRAAIAELTAQLYRNHAHHWSASTIERISWNSIGKRYSLYCKLLVSI